MQLTQNFFYEQQEEDLYFVMERVSTPEQADVWHAIYDFMENYLGNSSKNHMIIRELIKSSRGDMSDRPWRKIQAGAGHAGQYTLECAVKTFGSERPVDLWIAYALSSSEAPTGPISELDFFKVELIMTVTTAAPFLYTWHMGITRNFSWKFYKPTKFHGRISAPLHGYAAQIMKIVHPELSYVRSNLAHTMSDILRKNFDKEVGKLVFFQTEEPVVYNSQTNQYTLYTCRDEIGQRDIIWTGPKADFLWPRHEGGSLNDLFIADINLLASSRKA
jgi:hypothetical protein